MEKYYFLSYHGLFLEYDADIGVYEQTIISSTKNINRFFQSSLEQEDILSFREILKIEKNGNFISIGGGNSYVTSLPDGRLIRQNVENLGDWEHFFKITERSFKELYEIVNKNWNISGKIIKKRDIYLCENYTINIGELKIGIYDFISNLSYNYSDRGSFSFVYAEKKVHAEEILDFEIVKEIYISPQGNIANRALQYLVGKRMQEISNNISIRSVNLPEWGLKAEDVIYELKNSCIIGETKFWFDIRGLSQNLDNGNVDSFVINGYPFNVDFYPSRDRARKYLPSFSKTLDKITGFSDDEIVFNIRADEVLHAVHDDYLVLPVEYYKMLAFYTGLKPVFFGQLADNPYIQNLKAEFPEARFVNGQGALYDFEVLRQSTNIAISVSTFSWLAAWLSNARNIYVPLAGMMNPCQAIGQNFIPRNDPAYKFISFPLCRAECLYRHPKKFWKNLTYMARNMKFISTDQAYEIFDRVDTLRNNKKSLGGFDPRFYMKKNYKEVSEPGMALNHYMHSDENEENIFPIKEREYVVKYPESGNMVASGYFKSIREYHSFVGNYLGNKNY
ncbi:hypothetical protein [Acetobacter cerevisiae]|uniref:Uncharacterized protein n=1 Tax=Acetobacter cerevisiae TaxID=178900 RepID=A0A149VAS9_9PROT|nr:hypothetical protein [Acetobacter cerevisiae]KXV77288.1 hypothetical protein AD954_08525 [Acetobacter cerevisiae]